MVIEKQYLFKSNKTEFLLIMLSLNIDKNRYTRHVSLMNAKTGTLPVCVNSCLLNKTLMIDSRNNLII